MEASVLRQGLRVLRRGIADEPRIFALATVGGSMFGLATIASAFVAGDIVAKVIEPSLAGHQVKTGALGVAVAVLFLVALTKVIGILGRRIGAGAMQYRLQARYRRRVTGRYLELPVAWHQRHATGTLLSNANADIEAAWYPIAPLPFAVATVVMLAVAVAALFTVDWALALVGLAVFPALFAVNFWYGRRIAPRIARVQALRAELSAAAHESFDGALVVKTMGREAHETGRFAARAEELRDAQIAVGRVRGLFDPLLDALPMLGTLAAMVVGGLRVQGHAVTVPDVISVAFLFSVLAVPVRAIGWVLADAPRAAVGWERVARVLAATGEMRYGTETPAGDDAVDLSFDGVGYAYPDGAAVLRDVTFKVPAGSTVALVGPTGSGKSTIAALAARLVDPEHGRVTVSGHDVKALSAAALAATVALVPQVPFVFDDSVAGNIALERAGVDGEAVRRALVAAQADRFVAALPDGLDTMVGERGTTLSGGQRQRLTLARALAGSPRLLVIDDATSAVDPRVEAAILAALRGDAMSTERTGGATILIVAYRRATIALADLVVYLDNGRVVATGPHEQLLKTVPGYAALVTAYEHDHDEAAEFDREAVA